MWMAIRAQRLLIKRSRGGDACQRGLRCGVRNSMNAPEHSGLRTSPAMITFAPVALLTAWALMQAMTVAGVAAYWRFVPIDPVCETAPGVVAIVPVRGPVARLDRFVAALLAQTVPVRLLFAVQAEDDPAWAQLQALAAAHPGKVQVVVAGLAHDEGQKVRNLLAALAALHPDDRFLIFLDCDMLPGPKFIGRLLFPLVRGKAEIATGYRWLAPIAANPVSWLGAAINLQVATFPRLPRWSLPWGGATAMPRETFERLDLARAWRGALSDDLTLYRVARAHGVAVRSVRDLLLASDTEITLAGLWRFGVRQYRHLLWNVPQLWWLAVTLVGLQGVGWIWALGWGGWPAVLVGYAAAALRAAARVAITRRLPHGPALCPFASVIADLALPFAVCWAHLALILAAATSRRIRWAGTDYWMRKGKVERMQPAARPEPTDQP